MHNCTKLNISINCSQEPDPVLKLMHLWSAASKRKIILHICAVHRVFGACSGNGNSGKTINRPGSISKTTGSRINDTFVNNWMMEWIMTFQYIVFYFYVYTNTKNDLMLLQVKMTTSALPNFYWLSSPAYWFGA